MRRSKSDWIFMYVYIVSIAIDIQLGHWHYNLISWENERHEHWIHFVFLFFLSISSDQQYQTPGHVITTFNPQKNVKTFHFLVQTIALSLLLNIHIVDCTCGFWCMMHYTYTVDSSSMSPFRSRFLYIFPGSRKCWVHFKSQCPIVEFEYDAQW